ncbi:SpoVR family protein [Clostridium sp. SYSU_GA19001]|uniref:SpoVR family protein n=1 Tax=Clostridium caldaquaticum TaxID=2940653 RepID=UPI002077615E|nr:SpoVR family protein [Clostridium caldaquaticum]MCM8711438.1 SpoVR family protein [Clostridium caldaquaticum]
MEYTLSELQSWNEEIENLAEKLGLDFYEQEFEIIGYNDMLAYEAYVGMPSRYPHWSFGKSYERNRTMYRYNLTGLPYEMVINSDPCLAYLMKENTLLLQILTMAHVYGHNDFFKNNRLFREGTRADYTIEMFKSHADRIRSYINDPSIGYEKVERVLDAAHAIKLQISRVAGEKKITDKEIAKNLIEDYRKKCEVRSILEPYEKPEPPDVSKIPLEPEEDIIYFIMKYGNLAEWEKNILQIVRDETLYFIPQIETKIMNEGWASYWHYTILKELELPASLHLEFIKRHNDVVAPWRGGLNPYFLGFKMFQDIEKRYGREKIFEVRELERDSSFLRRYLTQELSEELHLFEYVKKSSDYFIEEVSDEQGFPNIRNVLCENCGMGMVPVIRVIDMNLKDRSLTLEHVFDGRELNLNYAEATLKYLQELWGHSVTLITKSNGNEVKLNCNEKKVTFKL